jgi:hypothetical protein
LPSAATKQLPQFYKVGTKDCGLFSAVIASDIEHRFIRFGIPVKAFSDFHMQLSSASLLENHEKFTRNLNKLRTAIANRRM